MPDLKQKIENIIIYTTLFILAFFYCFAIETFKDVDMMRYFVNGFYMANYGMEGVPSYPNQLYSLFFYWGYRLTNNWYGLANILFLPLYLFGLYSLYSVLNYFIKHSYTSLLFTTLFLLVEKFSILSLFFSYYTAYFFFFISVIYLCLYHGKKIYLISFYFAVGTLFRSQLITFLPFLPFVINHKLSKKDYIKTIIPFLVALIVVQVGYETIKNIVMPIKTEGVNFKFYFKELDTYLLKSRLLTIDGLIFFLTYNIRHRYFYLVMIPCFFMFNKKFAVEKEQSTKPILTIFLILSLFIYFMPAIMYIKLGLDFSADKYFPLLSRYSFIMIPLLIPVYHFIIKNQPFIKLKNSLVYIAMMVVLLPILRIDKAPIFIKNTITNLSHKQEIYDIDSAKVKAVLKDNFKENAFFISNKWLAKIYIDPKARFKFSYRFKIDNNNNFHEPSLNNNSIDGIILIGQSYPYLMVGKTIYSKIYPKNDDITISIYKKPEQESN